MPRLLALTLAVLAPATLTHAAIDGDRIAKLPGWEQKLPSPQYSGYLDVGEGKHLHYWLATSEGESSSAPSKDPLVFWFNGGPGCSSLDGYFYEHGPMHVVEPVPNTTKVPPLYLNPSRWNRIANVVSQMHAPFGAT
jgi:serine carboxypeptidase-like clade 1